MYEYGICSVADEKIYKKQCKALEKNITNLEKKEELIDVDGSKIMIYQRDGKEVQVFLDYTLSDVHIKSEIELSQFF